MIPLNKPLISKIANKELSVNDSLSGRYPEYHNNLLLSARQGLDLIYHKLYEKHGKLRVYVSPLTCFEALFPIVANKHDIVFGDINPNTLNLDESTIPDNIDVIQAIHLGGNSQDMSVLEYIKKKRNLILIEDCAQAYGSEYNNKQLGLFGDFAVFSFLKTLHTIGGGFMLSKEEYDIPSFRPLDRITTVYRIVKRILETKNSIHSPMSCFFLDFLTKLKPEITEIFLSEKSINYYMHNSIVKQLSLEEELLEKRKNNALMLIHKIKNPIFQKQLVIPNASPNYTRLFYILTGAHTVNIIEKLRKVKIGANHLTQNWKYYYQNIVFKNSYFAKYADKSNLENYCEIHDRVICLPVSPALTTKEIDYIAEKVNKI